MAYLLSSGPYHILAYGTLLGTTIFQTFVGGITQYMWLPRAQFAYLQMKTFPVYFSMQTALPGFLALTYPGSTPLSASGIKGLVSQENFWAGLVPIMTMGVTAVINLLLLGPWTTKVMKQRKGQETRDGRKYDEEPVSGDMKKLNSAFMQLHGWSSTVNLITLGAQIWYAWTLAGRMLL